MLFFHGERVNQLVARVKRRIDGPAAAKRVLEVVDEALEDDDLVFYAIDAAYFGGLGGGVDYINQWKKPPSCVVRIVRDAAGTATSLVIDEVNWDGPSADLEAFMVNAPDPAAPWRATPGPSYR